MAHGNSNNFAFYYLSVFATGYELSHYEHNDYIFYRDNCKIFFG
jgi:hypothetical protein